MTNNTNQPTVHRIEAYDLPSLLLAVQDAVLDGYRLDYTSVENYPSTNGVYFSTGMLLQVEKSSEVEVLAQEQQEQGVEDVPDGTEAPQKAQRGRPKGKVA